MKYIKFLYFLILTSLLLITISKELFAVNNEFNIKDYGAISDGKTLNNEFIQKAINDANKSGGRVVIPSGIFLTGSIILKSNVELHFETGAILLGSNNIKDYKSLGRWKSLILCEEQENVKISGNGIIDGQGRTLALKVDSLYYIGELEEKFYNKRRKRPNELARPQLLEFVKCNNVSIQDIKLKDAASWVQTYEL